MKLKMSLTKLEMKMKSKSQKAREYFAKHPLATPKEVGAKFDLAMPIVYKLRKEEQAKFIERSNEVASAPIIEKGFVDAQTTREMAFDHPLFPVLMSAIEQAMFGKGQRHGGNVTPFFDQPWNHYAKMHGRGFLTGQAAKKLEEAASLRTGEAFKQEMLGAIVYCGMALLKEAENEQE
jgi:hypothetical protein